MKYLFLFLLTACSYGLSASATVPIRGTYCESINDGYTRCYPDYGRPWGCHITAGYWSCNRESYPRYRYWRR